MFRDVVGKVSLRCIRRGPSRMNSAPAVESGKGASSAEEFFYVPTTAEVLEFCDDILKSITDRLMCMPSAMRYLFRLVEQQIKEHVWSLIRNGK
ncbi:MAG: hypothetical protein P4M11_03535 [Candidatus Pacebacteria bacterium]|nr:hypothetical protein [Candidatus Paceibacterota bacterium]